MAVVETDNSGTGVVIGVLLVIAVGLAAYIFYHQNARDTISMKTPAGGVEISVPKQ